MAGHSRRASSGLAWEHLPALDGLRAAAVIAVLLFHAGHLQGGFLGVDLFFALSGFLITSLLLRDVARGDVRLLAFWERRFRRLLPAVFALIAVVALWAWTFGTPAELDGVRRTGGWALGYVANWRFIGDADGYWASFDRPSMFDHLWSLAIEEQFYVVWPLVVLVVWKLTARANPTATPQRVNQALLAISIAGVVASFVTMLALYSPGSDPTRVYMGTDTRAASILVGAALATAPARRLLTRALDALGRGADAAVALIAIGIGVSWLVVDGASSSVLYRGGLLLHSLAAAAVVTALVSVPRGRAGEVLSWRPLVWVGVRSYGLYLWHWPVYVALSSDRTGLDGPALTTVRIAVSTALAAVSFHYVEDPIRNRAMWVRDRRGIPALAGAVALVAATLIVLPHPRHEIAAFDPVSITATPDKRDPPRSAPPPDPVAMSTLPSAASTTTVPAPVNASTASLAIRPISSVLWIGDSIAYDLAPGVGAALTSAGLNAELNADLGMRLVDDSQYGLLPRLRTMLPSAGVDVVVVQLSVLDADGDVADQRAALDALQAMVVGNGTRLVLVSPPPTVYPATDSRLVAMTEHARAIAAADPSSTSFLDSTVVWGPEFDDDLDDDGTPERKRDGVHVCPSGAARFAQWLTAELVARFDGPPPTPPTEWALGSWVIDDRYDEPVGSCAPLT